MTQRKQWIDCHVGWYAANATIANTKARSQGRCSNQADGVGASTAAG